MLAISKGAQFIEKHYSNSKALNTSTEMAHVCSMNYDDLRFIREYADNLALIKNMIKKNSGDKIKTEVGKWSFKR